MFLVSNESLVAEVSNAGGLGTIPAHNYRKIDELRGGIEKIKSLTSLPFGVNIILHKEHCPDWADRLQVLLEEKVPVIITSLGLPRTIVERIKASGAVLISDVVSLKQALLLEKIGADIIVGVSHGAGGHAGPVSAFSLIPYLKDNLQVPVVAAGGITDGRQMAAAFALGAEGVYVGTRLINSTESSASSGYKQMIVESTPDDIVFTDKISGIGANWLRQSLEKGSALLEKNDHDFTSLKRWKDIWSAGTSVAQIENILPAKVIVQNIINQFQEICAK